MKKIVVLGSTGSVGRNTIEVARHHGESFEIVGVSIGNNVELLIEQLRLLPGIRFAVGTPEAYQAIEASAPDTAASCMGTGEEGIGRLIDETAPDLVVNCLVGFVGLKPTMEALERGIPVAIANKESIVAGGEILVNKSRESGAPLIPIDSEHVAISQCLAGRSAGEIRRVFITASGGSLRDKPVEELASAGLDEVLSHPTWNMGDKITVDSATMVNKGLEIIEAHWLFGIPYEKIEVVIHPQSTVHSMVELTNRSIIAQLSIPDMKLPILHALSYPETIATDLSPSTISKFPALSFEEVDYERYPCLRLAMRAAESGGNRPAVLNSANEEAVRFFLQRSINFAQIHDIIKSALEGVPFRPIRSLEDILAADGETRTFVRNKFCL